MLSVVSRQTLLLDFVDIFYKCGTTFTASLLALLAVHHSPCALLDISTQTDSDGLAGSSELVNSFASILDE